MTPRSCVSRSLKSKRLATTWCGFSVPLQVTAVWICSIRDPLCWMVTEARASIARAATLDSFGDGKGCGSGEFGEPCRHYGIGQAKRRQLLDGDAVHKATERPIDRRSVEPMRFGFHDRESIG